MPDDATLNFEVRPTCAKCERLAVVYDDDNDTALCARHATIFMIDFGDTPPHKAPPRD
jgi:hypothetical protein